MLTCTADYSSQNGCNETQCACFVYVSTQCCHGVNSGGCCRNVKAKRAASEAHQGQSDDYRMIVLILELQSPVRGVVHESAPNQKGHVRIENVHRPRQHLDVVKKKFFVDDTREIFFVDDTREKKSKQHKPEEVQKPKVNILYGKNCIRYYLS